jgi:hypothetical protein
VTYGRGSANSDPGAVGLHQRECLERDLQSTIKKHERMGVQMTNTIAGNNLLASSKILVLFKTKEKVRAKNSLRCADFIVVKTESNLVCIIHRGKVAQ